MNMAINMAHVCRCLKEPAPELTEDQREVLRGANCGMYANLFDEALVKRLINDGYIVYWSGGEKVFLRHAKLKLTEKGRKAL